MSTPLYHYNPKDVVITFGEVLIEGIADDSFITIDQAEDDTSVYVGADGHGTRTMSNNNAANVEINISQSSPTNAMLSAISKLDRETGQGIRPLMIKDLNGNDLFVAAKAWIARRPRREFGKTVKTRTWKFQTHDLTDFDGGSNAPPLPA